MLCNVCHKNLLFFVSLHFFSTCLNHAHLFPQSPVFYRWPYLTFYFISLLSGASNGHFALLTYFRLIFSSLQHCFLSFSFPFLASLPSNHPLPSLSRSLSAVHKLFGIYSMWPDARFPLGALFPGDGAGGLGCVTFGWRAVGRVRGDKPVRRE